jgi:GNAT superfamily N-acetyltransferase
MHTSEHDLSSPKSREEWNHYHAIRRRVLWEGRGLYGVYDENHPDELKPGHHPFVLMHRGDPVGVIRVDIDGKRAIFRRVAVKEDLQRTGQGRVLLMLAESYAKENGCDHVVSFVSPDAVGFYEKCGFELDSTNPPYADHVPMRKRLDQSIQITTNN